MFWLRDYFQYLIVFFPFLIALYLVGKLILFCFQKFLSLSSWSPYEDLFASLLIGCFAVVTAFSILITHGKTINLLFLLVAAALVWRLRKESKESTGFSFLPRLRWKQGLELLGYAWLIYTFFTLGVIRNSDWSTFLLFRQTDDWGCFSVIMQTMLITGQENVYDVYNLLDPTYGGMVPFHYMEMWISGLLKFVYPASLPMYLIGTVVYPFYTFLALIGTWAFLECWIHPPRWFHRLMVLLCFYGTGWFFLNLIRQDGLLELFTSNLTINFLLLKPRWGMNYSCFLAFLLLWVKQRELLGFITLLTLPIASFDSLPVVMGGALLYAFLSLRKQQNLSGSLLATGLVFGLFLLITFLMYREFGNSKLGIYTPLDILRLELTLPQNGILFLPLFFFRGLLQITILYSFHLLILYLFLRYNDKKHFHNALLLSSLMMLSALGAWSVFYALFDSIQMTTGFLSIYQTLLLILGVILLTRVRIPAKMLIGGYIILGAGCNFLVFSQPYFSRIYSPISQNYLNTLRDLTPTSRVGVSIQSRRDFEGGWHLRNPEFPLGTNYLPFLPQYLKTVELGVFDIPETPFRSRPNRIPLLNVSLDFSVIDAYRSRAWKEMSIFYRYFQRMRLQRPDLSVEEAQLAFIDEYKIDWAIVSGNAALSPILQRRIAYEVQDPNSGQRFLLLRPATLAEASSLPQKD